MAVHGWLILDKPAGMTSTRAGSLVKRLLKTKKLGHAGTLDPFATGVLPLALGEATKTIPYVVADEKAYRFQITWGEERTTEDIEGDVMRVHGHRPEAGAIAGVLPQFLGSIMQQPPIYSALKIKGECAYALARRGEDVVLAQRLVHIHSLALISIDNKDQATFEVTCGPGTYVRSLGRDIARLLGTFGYLSQLRRLKVGKFDETTVISMENFEKISHNSKGQSVILSIGAVLDDIPAVPVSESDMLRIQRGQDISTSQMWDNGQTMALWYGNDVIALGVFSQIPNLHPPYTGLIHPQRVLNYNH